MAGTGCKAYMHAVSLTTSYLAILQIKAPTNIGVLLKSLRMSFSDLSLAPHDIKYERSHTTVGSGGTTVTPKVIDGQHDQTVQTACQGATMSTAPSGGVIIEEYSLGPGGLIELLEKIHRIAPGETFVVFVKGSAATGTVSVGAEFEE
jgi:hypothetical protein